MSRNSGQYPIAQLPYLSTYLACLACRKSNREYLIFPVPGHWTAAELPTKPVTAIVRTQDAGEAEQKPFPCHHDRALPSGTRVSVLRLL